MKKYKRIISALLITLSITLTMCFQITPSYAAPKTWEVGNAEAFVSLLNGTELNDGDTIKFTGNITRIGDGDTLDITKSITIDTNGYYWYQENEIVRIAANLTLVGNGPNDSKPAIEFHYFYFTMSSDCSVTIHDMKMASDGMLFNTSDSTISIDNSVLLSGTVYYYPYTAIASTRTDVIIKSNSRISGITNDGTININEGATLLLEHLYDLGGRIVETGTLLTTSKTASLTINPSDITYDGNPITVGTTDTDVTYSYTGDANVEDIEQTWYEYDAENAAEGYKGETLQSAPKDVGKYVLELSAPDGILYGAITKTIEVEIKQKDLTVTASNQTINEMQAISQDVSQVSSQGLLTGHTITSLKLSQSTTDVTNNGEITIDEIAISDSSGKDVTSNYNITKVKGRLIINEADIYHITNQSSLTWTQGDTDGLVINADGDIDKFVKVKIDDQDVDTSNYNVVSGSTIVTLKPEYLTTLSIGSHDIEILWNDGYVRSVFTINAKANASNPSTPSKDPSNNPAKGVQTSDNMSINLMTLTLLISGLGIHLLNKKTAKAGN